jgi:uncharacterized membrane protein YhaH (DUF805 family)
MDLSKDSVVSILKRSLQYRPRFAGRATRTELLFTFLATVAVLFIIGVVDGLITTRWTGAAMFPYFVTMVPLISVINRRFHDTNRTGWAWFTFMAPYIGVFIFVGLMLWDGVREDNIFGPDPRRFRLS